MESLNSSMRIVRNEQSEIVEGLKGRKLSIVCLIISTVYDNNIIVLKKDFKKGFNNKFNNF